MAKKRPEARRSARRYLDREAEAIDRLLVIWDDLAIGNGWKSAARAFGYVLLRRYPRMGSTWPWGEVS